MEIIAVCDFQFYPVLKLYEFKRNCFCCFAGLLPAEVSHQKRQHGSGLLTIIFNCLFIATGTHISEGGKFQCPHRMAQS
jgi:hypothetical protein